MVSIVLQWTQFTIKYLSFGKEISRKKSMFRPTKCVNSTYFVRFISIIFIN